MSSSSVVFTITVGNAGENHAGMEMIGTPWVPGTGHTIAELEAFQDTFAAKGATTEMVYMSDEGERAAVLVIKKGVDVLLGAGAKEALFAEQAALKKDEKALMRGRVVNKRARHNLCFAAEGHPPDYESGKGTVVAYKDVPHTKALVEAMETAFQKKGPLIAEGNYYYDLKKCGIGFHGDKERVVVYAARLGASMPLHFQWFHRSEPVGERILVPLDDGDVYIMSEKAVGADWMCRSKRTLRHATGCPAFTTIKPKKATVTAVSALPSAGAGTASPAASPDAVSTPVKKKKVAEAPSAPVKKPRFTEE